MGESYQAMYDAYVKVFDRLGLDYVVVEADPGQIGGGVNHEFMALADVGEDLFVRCENGDYLADTEAATPRPPDAATDEELPPLTEVETPGAVTIELMSEQMGLPAEATMKCILFDVAGRSVAVLVPGDREVNEEKLPRALPARVRPFEDDDFAERGSRRGSSVRRASAPMSRSSRIRRSADAALGDGRESPGCARDRRDARPGLPRRPMAGPRAIPRGRSMSGRRRTARDRALDRGRAHLPARDVLLGTAAGDLPGRRRFAETVRDGVLWDRDHADHVGGRRAEPR